MSWDETISALERTCDAFAEMASGRATAALAESTAVRGAELLLEGWQKQQAPDGSAWAAPAMAYGHPLLDATGAMKASASCTVITVALAGFSLLFHVADDKAAWHQFGTMRGGATTSPLRPQNRKSFRAGQSERQHVPARPMLFDSPESAAPWIQELELHAVTTFETWLSARLAF